MKEINLLDVGADAPHFNYMDAEGIQHETKELLGSWWLVYFYPKDNTPGCNKEACGFRDLHPDFSKMSLTVIGVSCDSEKSHLKFRSKFNLPFGLATDETKEIVHRYGIWGKKKFMGKIYEGIHRVSYLINNEGKIAKVYPKVKPPEHASQVLDDVRDFL